MTIPAEARFIKSHEYVLPQGGTAAIGISRYAADQLGDVVFVETPAVGTQLKKGASFGVVESVKAVSDLYAPVDGTVVAVNEALTEEPGLVSEDPFGRGWIVKVELADAAQLESEDLMAPGAYEGFVGEAH
ncbi:MAG: glycine cleavage system protein GcvH [Candidatus Sericytochromatia bacterium]